MISSQKSNDTSTTDMPSLQLFIFFPANSITVTKIGCNKTTNDMLNCQVWLLVKEHKYNNKKSLILKNGTTAGVAAADPAAVTQMNSLFVAETQKRVLTEPGAM